MEGKTFMTSARDITSKVDKWGSNYDLLFLWKKFYFMIAMSVCLFLIYRAFHGAPAELGGCVRDGIPYKSKIIHSLAILKQVSWSQRHYLQGYFNHKVTGT